MPARSQARAGEVGQRGGGPAVDRPAVHRAGAAGCRRWRAGRAGRRRAAHTTGPMPSLAVRGHADDGRAGAVAEQERRAAVVRVDHRQQLLGADDEDVVGAAGPDAVGGQGQGVGEPGAAGADVGRAGVRRAEPVRDLGRAARQRAGHRAGRQQHEVDVGAGRRRRRRAPCRRRWSPCRRRRLVLAGDAARDDPAALADPRVGGVEAGGDVGVVVAAGGAVRADAADGPRAARRPLMPAPRAGRGAAARSSGVLRASERGAGQGPLGQRRRACRRGRARRRRSAPRPARVARHRSKRTGPVSWPTGGPAARRRRSTTAPSALATTAQRGGAGAQPGDRGGEGLGGRGHRGGVEGAGDVERPDPRAGGRGGGEGVEVGAVAADHDLAGDVDGGDLTGRPRRPPPATSSASPPSTAAMPVGRRAAAAAIAAPRRAASDDGLVGGDHAGDGERRQLADAVAADRVGLRRRPRAARGGSAGRPR